MGSENGGNIDAALLAQRNGYTSQPFVEVSNDSPGLLVADKLCGGLALLLRFGGVY